MLRSSLAGRTIVITRPRAQGGGLAERLRKKGARVVCAPVIRIVRPASYKKLDHALRNINDYDCVVFTSANGVQRFFARARILGLRRLKAPRLYAIGPATAAALKSAGWASPSLPSESHGEALARAIELSRGARILIPRARKARPELVEILRRRGARVDVVEAYRTVADKASAVALRRLVDSGRVDAVTFTSASTAEHLAKQLGAARFKRLFCRAAAASIGPVTTRALRCLGARERIQAARPDDAALVSAIAGRLGRAARA